MGYLNNAPMVREPRKSQNCQLFRDSEDPHTVVESFEEEKEYFNNNFNPYGTYS